MNNRLPALDGLRGFAALSVVLTHIGYSLPVLFPHPIFITIFDVFSGGSNAVQILFVLSGFLMALLYPSIPHAAKFIQKRYLRIFPVYAVIVFALWFISLDPTIPYYISLCILTCVTLLVYYGWNFLRTSSNAGKIGKWIFWIFISLQVGMLLFNLFITPNIYHEATLSPLLKDYVLLLSNLTLTTPFAKEIPRLGAVFWSLAPEILFYIVYPFIVIPLIFLAKRFGVILGICIVLGVTKILFDLDYAVASVAALQSMNIARTSGFVAGVVIGVIYQSQGTIWKKLEPIVSNPIIGFIGLFLLIFIQWGDANIRYGQSVYGMNLYYLISSWIIAFVVLTAINTRTIIYSIFSKKVFVSLGLISYSLYLIHAHIGEWLKSFMNAMKQILPPYIPSELLLFFIALASSVIIAWVLFYFVERQYFLSKPSRKDIKVKSKGDPYTFSRKSIIISVSVMLVLFLLYSGNYSATQLLHRHMLQSSAGEISLLKSDLKIPFTAKENDLEEMSARIRYVDSVDRPGPEKEKKAYVHARLFDSNGKLLEQYDEKAYNLENSQILKFELAEKLPQSDNKKYVLELSLTDGEEHDQIFIDSSSTSMVSVYANSRNNLLHNPIHYIANRILFVFTNLHFVFAVVFVSILTLLIPLQEYLKRKK